MTSAGHNLLLFMHVFCYPDMLKILKSKCFWNLGIIIYRVVRLYEKNFVILQIDVI